MSSAIHFGEVPPVYKIDLSLPPADRYVKVAEEYCDVLKSITRLFDELVESVAPNIQVKWVKHLARLFLRRLYTDEETQEIKGISRVTGIEMYLLVSLNVLLDLLMGCTSGAALAKDNTYGEDERRLLHFRTLDWGMDLLRKLLVRFEFVRSPNYSTVLATNISYVGFVGVLTGVRKGLSVSLNFRPNHNTDGLFSNYRYYGNHLLVLLGVRRSISSMLRQYIIPSGGAVNPPLNEILPTVMRAPSTAAYLIFCDGIEAFVLEKDHRKATLRSDSAFIVATNSDHITPSPRKHKKSPGEHLGAALGTGVSVSINDFIQESDERKACMQSHWDKKLARARRVKTNSRQDPLRRTRSSQKHTLNSPTSLRTATSSNKHQSRTTPEPEITATTREIIDWTAMYPTTNEMTHFSAVMDPSSGRVIWIRRFLDPLSFGLTDSD
ncbi:hypothetical protein PHISCL_02234 [Aspergillus sclerotialis]|uniref:ceramidase n=1 Tax=Aspergillus sclerotialis TaxID=2070753 RepID=A0A3A3A7R9_9EURO|nr:hypothetical protein PHISCL_02234 [Aspergillus sclerotialis]